LIRSACEFLRKKGIAEARLFIVAGSGFRDALPELSNTIRIAMSDVPGLPAPRVAGHGAELIAGDFVGERAKIPALIATGRVHLYEGRPASDVVFATRMAHAIGCTHIVLTNAAGSVNPDVRPGSLMAISDHINLTGHHCESGSQNGDGPVHFTDMTNAYDQVWRDAVIREIGRSKVNQKPLAIDQGVYIGLTGPSYETPAETRMLRLLGADAVGMSTVQECIAARTLGMKVFGLSLITNMAGGLGDTSDALDHHEVLGIASRVAPDIQRALGAILNCAP
jgi:purine-nucleoside phosphorylase